MSETDSQVVQKKIVLEAKGRYREGSDNTNVIKS